MKPILNYKQLIMETKMIRVPFDVELAKAITNGSKEGRIVTRDGRSARVICWDFSNIQNIVSAISQEDGVENLSSIFHDGTCSLSSRCDEDLFIEIPEYMTFKDGDVLTCYGEYKWIFIYRESNYKTGCYAALDVADDFFELNPNNHVLEDEDIKELRYATKSEKKKLIKKLKASKDPKAKEYLKRFFGIEQKAEYEFKAKDWVLVRDSYDEWHLDIFSHKMSSGGFSCVGGVWSDCIPYNKQTAHLLGTTENYE